MKTLTTLFSKVYFGVKNRKQELSNICCTVSKKIKSVVKSDDDFVATGNLVLA